MQMEYLTGERRPEKMVLNLSDNEDPAEQLVSQSQHEKERKE